jgi:hypothetical protein
MPQNCSATIISRTDFTSNSAVLGAPSLTAAEGNVAHTVGGNGIGYFTFGGNEYIVATGMTPSAGASTNNYSVVGDDAVVTLTGGAFHHNTAANGFVTLIT